VSDNLEFEKLWLKLWLRHANHMQRFLMLKPVEVKKAVQINIILNWFEELKRLVPTGN